MALSIVIIIHHPKSFWCAAATPQRFTVGAANNTPACQPEALPARYKRTASLSTYTHNLRTKHSHDKIRDSEHHLFFLITVRSFSHRSLPRVRFSRDLNLKFEFLNVLVAPYFGCLCVCPVAFFVFHHGAELRRLQQLHSRLVCTWKRGEWCFFIMENGGLALKQKKGSLSMMILQ
jgi:hypothetical protein